MILILCVFIVRAEFFDKQIEYFKDESKTSTPKITRSSDQTKTFKWSTYLNEKNDEFFREGDYIPPAPFLEAMRNPTKSNILLFEKWHEKKNFLLNRFNEKRAQVLGKQIPTDTVNDSKATDITPLLKNFSFIFYFDSMCSSCRGMFEVVNEIAHLGIYIEAVRVDSLETDVQVLGIPWQRASKKEMEQAKISAVPLLIAFDKKSKKAFKIVGKKSIYEISEILKNLN